MNILPFVFAMLIVFGGMSLLFIKDARGTALTAVFVEGRHRAERAVNNHLTRMVYAKKEAGIIRTTVSHVKPKTVTSYHSRRILFPPLEQSKFNLEPLLKEPGEISSHPLYPVLITLVEMLYHQLLVAHTTTPETTAAHLVHALIQKGRSLKTPTHLSQLSPDDPQLHALYYQMLQGTNRCDADRGFSPFGDYFCLHDKAPPISLAFATPPILEALFGKKVKDAILLEESNRWDKEGKHPRLSKKDLQEILSHYPIESLLFTKFEPYLHESKEKLARKEWGGQDQKTKILVRKTL